MSDDDEAAQAYSMLNDDEWNQEFRQVEKAAGNAGRVRSGASPSTSVVEALEVEWEQSTEEDEEEQEEEEEDKGRAEEEDKGREQDGAEEETEEESRGEGVVEHTIDVMMKGHAAPVTKLTVDLLSLVFCCSHLPSNPSVAFFSRKGFSADSDLPYKGRG